MVTPTDLRLLERIQAGDPIAFNAFYQLNAPQVHRIALRMTGSRADADDLTQVVFERVWRALPRFRRQARLSTWLHRIAVNACLDHLKSAGHARRAKAPPGDVLDTRRDPEMAVAGAQATAQVQQALLRLSEKSRVVLVLKDIEGRSYQEMRAILRLPITTLKMRVVRARTQLAGVLKRQEGPNARL